VSKAAKGGRKGNSAVTGNDGGGAKDPDESYTAIMMTMMKR